MAFSSPPFKIREVVARDVVVEGIGQGVVPGRSAEKHTSSGDSIGLAIQSSIIPLDGRPRRLDAISEAQSRSYRGPRELYCSGVPLGTRAELFATHAPRRWDSFSFEEEVADDVRFHG